MSPKVPSLITAPRLTPAATEELARELFDLSARATELPSERDQNFRLDAADGQRYVLKIANAAERREMLEAENAVMRHLSAAARDLTPVPPGGAPATRDLTPVPLPTRGGDNIGEHDGHFVRLITWIAGRPLGDVVHQSDALLEDLGRAVATIDAALASFDHPALHRTFHWDLAQAPAVIARQLPAIADTALRPIVERVLALHAEHAAPRLASFRRSVIHADANDYNVLVDPASERIAGLVDFGDMVVSHTVNDLAIAMAYAALGKPDPLAAAARVAAGYHAVHPLTEDEIAALFALMLTRLALSVSVAAAQQAEKPDAAYLGISQGPIRETLPALAAIHPRLAHYLLRDACGLPPVPHAPRLVEWLRTHTHTFSPVTGHDLKTTPVLGLDLSAGSTLVASNPADNTAEPFTRRLFDAMRDAGAVMGVGGYDEARLIYAADQFASGTVLDERRTLHIGLDITMPAGTPLYAPLDGIVHGFEDARTRLDYGPVIVLEHFGAGGAGRAGEAGKASGADQAGTAGRASKTGGADAAGPSVAEHAKSTTSLPAPPAPFYTLWGHLDRASLDGLYVGKPIHAGERFAAIGAPPVNGDWWPHVHFQVIADMLDVPVNFNGVAPASQRRTWLSLCPDPNLLLGIPDDRLATHPGTPAVHAQRQRHFGGNVRLSYRPAPLQIVRGWKQYLFDETGRTYIDAYNNVPHVGHAHPRVTAAVAAQLATLNTNTRYLHETVTTYAAELAACFPAPLEVCFFTASGSEANELALRLARAHTRARDLIVMDAAYHGHTTTLIDISPYKHAGPGGDGAPDWVHASPIPDVYRGRYRADDPPGTEGTVPTVPTVPTAKQAGVKYAGEVGAIVERITGRGRRLCGYIAETCPSVGGQIMLPPGYLPEVYRLVRAAGGVCIADEVQTGFGRLGTHFWAFAAHAVTPDIVVLGKPIANGYPMGAVITTRAIADSFDNGMEFFSTFGGSTAACAAGLATLRTTLDERLQAHALRVGEHLLARLRALQQQHALIGDVRGSGLFIGVELVRDRDARTPATEDAEAVVQRMRQLGVLAGTDGPDHNVIKIRGPMPLGISDADCIADVLDRALSERQ